MDANRQQPVNMLTLSMHIKCQNVSIRLNFIRLGLTKDPAKINIIYYNSLKTFAFYLLMTI